MDSSTSVLESTVDWLTATTHDKRAARRMIRKAEALAELERSEGSHSVPWSLGNYFGQRCGRVRYGNTMSAALVQLSGQLASDHFLWFANVAADFTRLDIAVTVQLADYDPGLGLRAYESACAWRKDHPRAAGASYVTNSEGGSTCYVGKRTSDRYLRVYDKQAESIASEDPAAISRYQKCWRYELETHDAAANAIRDSLLSATDRSEWVSSYLAYHCRAHGITPVYPLGSPPTLPTGFRRRSDRDSRLEWISRTVAPTIRWLLDTTPPDELADRLGLPPRSLGPEASDNRSE